MPCVNLMSSTQSYPSSATGKLPQQTLITTRNRYANEIPAQKIEVTKFDPDESLKLLYELSEIPTPLNLREDETAVKIVEELDHLASKRKFSTFLEDYAKYRPDLLHWTRQGLRQYHRTLAATSNMSFDVIRKNNPTAAALLRLLSFLNPDGILVQFLTAGAQGLQDDLNSLSLIASSSKRL